MQDEQIMKICSRCKIERALICFGKDKNSKDLLAYSCKECQKLYKK